MADFAGSIPTSGVSTDAALTTLDLVDLINETRQLVAVDPPPLNWSIMMYVF
jgi:hypothetical protein